MSAMNWGLINFSPNGGMAGSDMVIGWVDDQGKAYFTVSCQNSDI